VTPSDSVDQAWHLHMVYTRSYWDELCGKTLGKPLHHGPTKGGLAEDLKFHEWYERTLKSYEQEFQEPPPADIWPGAKVRFSSARRFQRVDVADVWLVPKEKLRAAAILIVGGAFCCLWLVACSGDEAKEGGLTYWFLGLAVLLMVVIRIAKATRLKSSVGKRSKDQGCGAGCGGGVSSSGCGSSGDGGDSGCGGGGCGGGD
jgi:uncharacterized membrane protein YgcG